jgi:hypothetical protein
MKYIFRIIYVSQLSVHPLPTITLGNWEYTVQMPQYFRNTFSHSKHSKIKNGKNSI